MQITKHKVATISYTLTDNDGTVIDKADENEPFAFIHGVGNIIPGLENALENKVAGDSLSVVISPEDGYGERDETLTQTISKNMFEGVDEVMPGMQFHAQMQDDQGMSVVTVTEVEGDDVTIDGNHPLAGTTLNFDVTVIGVRDATEEELDHGHAHGPGGHNH